MRKQADQYDAAMRVLRQAGFVSPDDVQAAVQRAIVQSEYPAWVRANYILARRYRIRVDECVPNRPMWQLVKAIGELTEDSELQAIARAALLDEAGQDGSNKR
jgi:hypothetical protein